MHASSLMNIFDAGNGWHLRLMRMLCARGSTVTSHDPRLLEQHPQPNLPHLKSARTHPCFSHSSLSSSLRLNQCGHLLGRTLSEPSLSCFDTLARSRHRVSHCLKINQASCASVEKAHQLHQACRATQGSLRPGSRKPSTSEHYSRQWTQDCGAELCLDSPDS